MTPSVAGDMQYTAIGYYSLAATRPWDDVIRLILMIVFNSLIAVVTDLFCRAVPNVPLLIFAADPIWIEIDPLQSRIDETTDY